MIKDLEQTVFPRYELVGNIKDQMTEIGASYASMSGSGSAVYGIFSQDFVAIHAYESFHELGFPANLTRPGFQDRNSTRLNSSHVAISYAVFCLNNRK